MKKLAISASWRTLTPERCYKPYGEALADEHNTSYEQPWKFNGKELDSETGLYYYGARYYEPVLALWYGVDPLYYKYDYLSPYSVCAGNPIKIRDEQGAWLNIVVGAISGALLDYSIQVVSNVIQNGEISLESFTEVDGASIMLSAAVGATGVGLVSKFSKLSELKHGVNTIRKTANDSTKTTTATNEIKEFDKFSKVKDYIKEHGKAPDGYKGGRTFKNMGGKDCQKLPQVDKNGNNITYREWDVDPMPTEAGQTKNADRLITGSDGSVWKTTDHYKTFEQIE